MKTIFLLAALLVAAPFLAGCNKNLYSPPARPMPLESAATLPPGDTGIQAEGSYHSRLFGPTLYSGTARVRHGMAEDVDLSAEVSATRIEFEQHARAARFIHSARAGAKVRVAKPLAIAGGLGGGYSAGGAFVSPEAGPIVAWENPYVVPFLATRFGVSQPLSPRDIDTSEAQDRSEMDRPRTTWIATAVLGVRIPLGAAEPGTVRGSLLGGAGFTHLADERTSDTFTQFAAGGEIAF